MADPSARIDYEALWRTLPVPALFLDEAGNVAEANAAAEGFLGLSRRALRGRCPAVIAGEDSALAALAARAAAGDGPLAEYGVELAWPGSQCRADLFATPDSGGVLVVIHPRASAERMGRQFSSRDAARSVAGLAAMLAHEIRNPLAGISGAAQLLAMSVAEADRELTGLIREEAGRIGALVARFEQFGDMRMARRRPVNIHDVLDRAVKSTRAGVAAHLDFVEEYDPSLPPTAGDQDHLMQVMVNLLKNAAEAAPRAGGVVRLRTAYSAGMKLRTARGTEALPLLISISDNGSGVPDDLRPHIFEPFVTSKANGSGLGLALVSKVIADHGGIVSCNSAPGRTTFEVLLPVWQWAPAGAEGAT